MRHLKKDLAPALLLVLLTGLILCPLITVFAKAVIVDGRLDLYQARQTIAGPENVRTVANSMLLGVCVVLCSTVIALPTAYLLARTQLSKHSWLDIIFMIPFMTPPYIASMGWILFMQKKGLFQQLFPTTGSCSEGFFCFGGLVLVMSLHVFPFLMTMLKNAMLNIPASLEESGAVFGAGFMLRMRRIFAPLLTGNYAIGALLVFVKTLSEYGTPYTLGRRIGFYVFTTDMQDKHWLGEAIINVLDNGTRKFLDRESRVIFIIRSLGFYSYDGHYLATIIEELFREAINSRSLEYKSVESIEYHPIPPSEFKESCP